jgi:hypothetical protein
MHAQVIKILKAFVVKTLCEGQDACERAAIQRYYAKLPDPEMAKQLEKILAEAEKIWMEDRKSNP